jgi:NagD protein
MMRAARKELRLATSETVMIGDTMETDILGGVQMGYHTILVLSGGTKRSDLERHAYRPDLVLDSVADLAKPELRLESLFPAINRDNDTPLDLQEWVRRNREAV